MSRKAKVIWLSAMGGCMIRLRTTEPLLGVRLIIVARKTTSYDIRFANLQTNKKATNMPKLFKEDPDFVTRLAFFNDATPDMYYFRVAFLAKPTAEGKRVLELKRITNLEACEIIETGRKYFKKYLTNL